MRSSGNRAVDLIGQMNITGNVIPQIWCKKITYPSGKPCLNAIMILADFVYWYRPKEIRQESTGRIIGYKKKFKADMLQRRYEEICDQFGLSKKQVREAINILIDIGVVNKELRTITVGDTKISNVTFFEVVPEKLHEITFEDDTEDDFEEYCDESETEAENFHSDSIRETAVDLDVNRVLPSKSQAISFEVNRVLPSKEIAYSPQGKTYTENTTKNTTKTTTENNKNLSSLFETTRSTTGAVERIVAAWNSLQSYGITPIRKICNGTNRKRWLDARIRQYGEAAIMDAIENIKKSDFLQGKSDSGWSIKFDWFVKPNNFSKVLEGNYANNISTKAKAKSSKYAPGELDYLYARPE